MAVKSVYSKPYRKPKRVYTVKQLIAELAKLPPELPIGTGDGIRPVWWNVGKHPKDWGSNAEHLGFDDDPEYDDED